jgi:membrane peptidoglycan carboxypeptidase
VATVRLAQVVGLGSIADTAERMGIKGPIPQNPAMPLGTVQVSAEEIASAYTGFATLGDRVAPRLVKKVEDEHGQVLWEAPSERTHVIDPGVAYLVTDVLRDALEHGTGQPVRQAGFSAPAAGKTGTTNDGADAWFVGYTPDLVTAVWVGFDQPRPIMPRATGGRLAAPIWARVMKRAGLPARDWPMPSGVVSGWVDTSMGMLLASNCMPLTGTARREVFLAGHAPSTVCPSAGSPETMTTAADMGFDAEDGSVPMEPIPGEGLGETPQTSDADQTGASPLPSPSPSGAPTFYAPPMSSATPRPSAIPSARPTEAPVTRPPVTEPQTTEPGAEPEPEATPEPAASAPPPS